MVAPSFASNRLSVRVDSLPRRLAMSLPSAWPRVLDFFGTPLVIAPSQGQLSGDAGLHPIRQFDQRIGLTRAFANALDDPRDPRLTEHSFSTRTAPRCRRWLRNCYAPA